jgi:hypothetical protein
MSFNRVFSSACIGFTMLLGSGCGDKPSDQPASSVPMSVPPAVTGLSTGTGWDQSLGRVMILPLAGDNTKAGVVLPGLTDSTLASTTQFELNGLDTISVDLFNQDGQVGQARLHMVSQRPDATGCVNWPVASFLGPIAPTWRIGLESGRGVGLKLNMLAGMHGGDSARFVNDVLGAALGLTNTGDSVFRGLPFSVKRGSQINTVPSSVIVAEVVRKINEEANPREEHILLVAERPAASAGYRVMFTSRTAGAEESLETSDVLAAIQLKPTNQPVIVIGIDYEDGGKIGLLERSSDGSWKLRWKSAYTGC